MRQLPIRRSFFYLIAGLVALAMLLALALNRLHTVPVKLDI